MPPAEWIPSSVRPKGKRPCVRVCYSSRHKGEDINKTSERDVLILFLNPAFPCPNSGASSSITGNGSGWRGNRPPPAHCNFQDHEPGRKGQAWTSAFLYPVESSLLKNPDWQQHLMLRPDFGAPNAFMYLKYFFHKSLKILEMYNQWVLFFFFFNLQKQCWLRTYTELGEFQSCHLLAEGPLAIHRNYLLLGVFLYEQTPPHRRENYTRKQDENIGPEVNTVPSPMRKEAKQTNKQKTQGVSNTRVNIFSVLEIEVQHGKMTSPKSHRQYLW